MARRRGNKWQGDAKWQGKRVRNTFATKEEAEAWEAAVALAEKRGDPYPSPETVVNPEGITLRNFADENFGYLWGDAKAKKEFRSVVNQVVEAVGPHTRVCDIDSKVASDLVVTLEKRGNSNATINRKLSALSKLMRHAVSLGIAKSIPEARKRKEHEGRTRYLTKSEEAEVFEYFWNVGLLDSYHTFRFMLYTGARTSEVRSLTWRDIDRKTVTFWKTKGGKPRTIPLVKQAKEAVDYMESQGYKQPFAFNPNTLDDHWQRMREHLGYKDDPQFVIYVLRHTCASRMAMAGVDLRRIREWMGHKSIQTTLRYAHLMPGSLDVAAQALAAE